MSASDRTSPPPQALRALIVEDNPGDAEPIVREVRRVTFEIVLKDLLKDDVRIAYVEDYDLAVARLVTAGVDLWLNTPQPPLEASGTSGMNRLRHSKSEHRRWLVDGRIGRSGRWPRR